MDRNNGAILDRVAGNVTKKVVLYAGITCKFLLVYPFLGKWIHNFQEILKEILNPTVRRTTAD